MRNTTRTVTSSFEKLPKQRKRRKRGTGTKSRIRLGRRHYSQTATAGESDREQTGLVSASEIVKEAELRRKEQEERIEKMSAEKSGKNAKTLVRDKTTGRLLTQKKSKREPKALKRRRRNERNRFGRRFEATTD